MMLLGGDRLSKGQDHALGFIPVVHRPVTAAHGGLTDRDWNINLDAAPADQHAISANFEIRHFRHMGRQARNHAYTPTGRLGTRQREAKPTQINPVIPPPFVGSSKRLAA